MAAHFTQNAFQLLMVYLAQHGGQFGWGFDPDSAPRRCPWTLVALSLLSGTALLWLLHRAPGHRPARQMLTLSRDGVAVHGVEPLTDVISSDYSNARRSG